MTRALEQDPKDISYTFEGSVQEFWGRVLAFLRANRNQQNLSPDWFDIIDRDLFLVDLIENTLVFAVFDQETRSRVPVGVYWILCDAVATVLGGKVWARDLNVQIIVDPSYFVLQGKDGVLPPCEERIKLEETSRGILYNALVRPDRVITIPSALVRWLPTLGPALTSMVVGIRQALYLRSNNQFLETGTIEVTFEELARWSGMDERSFRAHVDDPALRWFFERVPHPDGEFAMRDPVTGITRRRPCLYRVSIDLPLPPGDEIALSAFLESVGIRENLDLALSEAVKTAPKGILSHPFSTPPKDWLNWNPREHTVSDVVHRLAGASILSKQAELLIIELSTRLMPDKKSAIQVPWYRFQYWFPRLGQARGWFTLLCEGEVYFNRKTGELRDVAQIEGSYDWFSKYLGINDRTVRRWFQPPQTTSQTSPSLDSYSQDDEGFKKYQAAREKYLDGQRRAEVPALLEKFVQIQKTDFYNNKVNRLMIKVTAAEPLIPEHEAMFSDALFLGTQFLSLPNDQQTSFLVWLRECRKQFRFIHEIQRGTDFRLEKVEDGTDFRFTRNKSGTDFRLSTEKDGTDFRNDACLLGTDFQFDMARISAFKLPTLNDLPIKILIDFLNNLISKTTINDKKMSTNQEGEEEKNRVVVSWNVMTILKRTIHSKAKIDQLTKDGREINLIVLISLLLYSASSRGENTTAGYIVRCLEEDPNSGAGWPYDDLAKLSKDKLEELIIKASRNELWNSSSEVSLWEKAMKNTKKEKIEELANRLDINLGS